MLTKLNLAPSAAVSLLAAASSPHFSVVTSDREICRDLIPYALGVLIDQALSKCCSIQTVMRESCLFLPQQQRGISSFDIADVHLCTCTGICTGQRCDAVRKTTAAQADEDLHNCWKRSEHLIDASIDVQCHAAAIATTELLYREPSRKPFQSRIPNPKAFRD